MDKMPEPGGAKFSYKYYHWGPFLFHVKITPKECQMILREGKKTRKKPYDFRHDLAGHLSEEYKFTEPKNFAWFQKYLEAYANGYNDMWRKGKGHTISAFRIDSLWINYMKAGDFNPPHNHSGDISFVIYPDMPKELIEENKNYKGTAQGPAGIAWLYGEEIQNQYINTVAHLPETGDLFIFPASLKHWVYPFRSNTERVSMSGNIFISKKYERQKQ